MNIRQWPPDEGTMRSLMRLMLKNFGSEVRRSAGSKPDEQVRAVIADEMHQYRGGTEHFLQVQKSASFRVGGCIEIANQKEEALMRTDE